MFYASREPRPEWLEACQRVAPPTEHASHLTVRWVPGTPEAPIQRWVAFECIPTQYAQYLPALSALDPESADPMHRWAWEYWTTRHALPIPTWVFQGAGGGHPYAWTEHERVLAKAGVLQPLELPLPGDLPYAEPDARAFGALQQRREILERLTDAHEARMVARAAAQQQARAAELKATEAAIAESTRAAEREIMARATVIDQDERHAVGGLVTDDDLARYIETGDLTHTR